MRLPGEPLVDHDEGDEDDRKGRWRSTVGRTVYYEYDPERLEQGRQALAHLGNVLRSLSRLGLPRATASVVESAMRWYREQK